MIKLKYIFLFLGFTLLVISCKPKDKIEPSTTEPKIVLEDRFQYLLNYPADAYGFPRSMSLEPQEIHKVPSKDWTSGFFPGNLWLIYNLTQDEAFKNKAMEWTSLMEDQKFNDGTHDMGFKIYCSFGEGYKILQSEAYKNVMLKSAKTLSTRFNEKVGSLRSWDFNKDIWDFPVIIDNMMNLELLFVATQLSGDSTYYKIAERHAITTLKNHVRPDNSIFHVVDYDPITGGINDKYTHQGYSKESSWARGQSWAIYGFTMAYRYTKNPDFLAQAEATTKFFLAHPNLPEDGIPYWDFDDPAIPDAPRDASAGAIVASALLELYTITKNPDYLKYSDKVLASLHSENYLLDESIKGPFILNHSTGNWPKNDEIDEPIVYADYYFLEALNRKKDL